MPLITWLLLAITVVAFAYGSFLTEYRLRKAGGNEFSSLSNRPNVVAFAKRRPLIYKNFILVCLTVIAGFTIFQNVFSFSTDFSIWNFLLQFLLILCLDDLWFYGMHRLFHVNHFLFRHIHSIHHRVRSTLPLDFLYVHPLEWLLGSIGIAIAVLIIYNYAGSVNAYAMCAYGIFRNFHEIDIHSGIPSKLTDKIPGFGTAEDHADHHGRVRCNYASTLKWLDYIWKTRCD